MAEEVLPSLYRIKVPLPRNPLGWVNSYVVKGPDRNLIIDTGLNRRECLDAITAGLREIGVDLKKTDFYITHNHSDHHALVPALAQSSSKVFAGRRDVEAMRAWSGWDELIGYVRHNGFPEKELQAAVQNHPGFKYGGEIPSDMTDVDDGDVLQYGDYHFRAVATPGHTIGHTCLYEPEKKVLFSGDHILFDITPNITCWSESENPLKNYLSSLDKINDLQVELVLPGHRRLMEDCGGRIKELKDHHERRNGEILSILKQGPKTAYQTASQMTWDIDSDSWEAFPASQKWFATGETVAHLRYLEHQGLIFRYENGCAVFSLTRAAGQPA